MTIRHLVEIRCDEPRCGDYRLGDRNVLEHVAGWRTVGELHYCPQHKRESA